MKVCKVCKKNSLNGNVHFFSVPKDVDERAKWSTNCQIKLMPTSFVCSDHFKMTDIIKSGKQFRLMPIAQPKIMQPLKFLSYSSFIPVPARENIALNLCIDVEMTKNNSNQTTQKRPVKKCKNQETQTRYFCLTYNDSCDIYIFL